MNLLGFFASTIGSLAWPAAVFGLVLMLRKPIRDLIPALQKLKYKELELDFDRDVAEIRAEVDQELPPGSQSALPAPDTSIVAKLAQVSPRAAVQEAWREVEQAALDAARQLGGDRFRNKSLTFEAIRLLERAERVDRGVISLLRDLRGLRNQAVHAPEFALSNSAALEYAASAAVVTRYLRSLADGS
jgi:hypothetical protein